MEFIGRLLGRTKSVPEARLRLVEDVSGRWSYHLARGDEMKAICSTSRPMMYTGVPLTAWGYRDHIPSTYCRECERVAIDQELGLPNEVRGLLG